MKTERSNMEHSFYNVGHAESILIKPDSRTLIVRDLGKNKKANVNYVQNFKLAYDEIIHAFNAGLDIDTIISHAHADHIDGFTDLLNTYTPPHKIFRTAYLPKQDFSNSKTLHYVLLRFSVYCVLICGKKSRASQRAKNWLNFRPTINALSQNIQEVSLGDTITTWSKNATILWPPSFNNDYPDYAEKDYKRLLRSVEALDTMQSPEFLEELRETNQKLSELLALSEENEETSEIKQLLDSLTSSFRNGSINRQSPLTFNIPTMTAYKHCIDNDSLVFAFDDHSALYLSDLYSDAMSSMIKANPQIVLNYQLLKSAHHGTRICTELQTNGHFDEIVHCCGITNANYGGPIIDYNSCTNGKVYCLDWDRTNTALWDPKVPQDPKTKILDPSKNAERVLTLQTP